MLSIVPKLIATVVLCFLSLFAAVFVFANTNGPKGRMLEICDGSFAELPTSVERASAGCVVSTRQQLSDPQLIDAYGGSEVERRYIVFVPSNLSQQPAPFLFVYHGYGVNAEAVAYYDTRNRFEELAEQEGFVVVYPNGPSATKYNFDALPVEGFGDQGFFQSCFMPRSSESLDVSFSRQIVKEVQGAGISIDLSRVYATGFSAGGGMAFTMAIEAPDLVAAIAPISPLPLQLIEQRLGSCQVHENVGRVSVAMLAATADPLLDYNGASPTNAGLPGMEPTRDSWLQRLGIPNQPVVNRLPDQVKTDSYKPISGTGNSWVERFNYPRGSDGQEFVYFKVHGGGHVWPHPIQTYEQNWPILGKNNQDIDLAEVLWEFFQRHSRQW